MAQKISELFPNSVLAANANTDTSNFDTKLSVADTTVQAALETLDAHVGVALKGFYDVTGSAGSDQDIAVPAGSTSFKFRGVAAGGGGGGVGAFYDKGGGGGAGEYGEGYLLGLTGVTHVRINLGTGGVKAAATNQRGGTGGDTVISKVIAATPTLLATLKGGTGGASGDDYGVAGPGGTGGTVPINSFLVDGPNGNDGRNSGTTVNHHYYLGNGGNSKLGSGGKSGSDRIGAGAGTGDVATVGKYGGGGAGGIYDTVVFDPSAAGDGRVILEFFG